MKCHKINFTFLRKFIAYDPHCGNFNTSGKKSTEITLIKSLITEPEGSIVLIPHC
jgi:hypothetical protein